MAGVGKLLKQAKKMQDEIQSLQEEFKTKTVTVSSGGGAITIEMNYQGEVQKLSLDEEFLKEDKDLIEETLTAALQEAAQQAKILQEEEMSKVTAGFGLPGLPGF